MENFDFKCKMHILFGRDVESTVNAQIKQYFGKRVLIIYDEGALAYQTLLSRVKASLDRSGIYYTDFFVQNIKVCFSDIKKGVSICKDHRLDFILAVGNSIATSCAKAISVAFYYQKPDLWALFDKNELIIKHLKVGMIPTTPSGGADRSNCLHVYNDEQHFIMRTLVSDSLLPVFINLNPHLQRRAPLYQTGLCVVEVFAHIVSVYFSDTKYSYTTDRLLEALLISTIEMSQLIQENARDYEASANLSLAGILSKISICSQGREVDPSLSVIQSVLSDFYDKKPAEIDAVIIPAWLTFILNDNINRLAKFAERVFNQPMNLDELKSSAENAIVKIRALFESFNLPTNLQDLGGGAFDIEKLKDKIVAYAKNNFVLDKFAIADKLKVEVILSIATCYQRNSKL